MNIKVINFLVMLLPFCNKLYLHNLVTWIIMADMVEMFRQSNRPVNHLQGYAITDVPFLYGTFIISHDRLLTPYIGTYYSYNHLNGSGAYTLMQLATIVNLQQQARLHRCSSYLTSLKCNIRYFTNQFYKIKF